MKFYLAARYGRREELCAYRVQLEIRGHLVTSRWLTGSHVLDDGDSPASERDGQVFALEDYADVRAADSLIAFTEPPRSTASRGGRHVELGLALAWEKRVVIIGPRENVFCWMPHVIQYETFEAYLAARWPT